MSDHDDLHNDHADGYADDHADDLDVTQLFLILKLVGAGVPQNYLIATLCVFVQ